MPGERVSSSDFAFDDKKTDAFQSRSKSNDAFRRYDQHSFHSFGRIVRVSPKGKMKQG